YVYGALKLIYTLFDVNKNAEITLEVNPGTIDEDKLKVYKNAGVNRFSVGLQSANDKTLRAINRIHNYNDFEKTMELLSSYNTSVDVMIGLPEENVGDVLATLKKVTSFKNVKHVSLYALKAEEGTPMFTKYLNGELLSEDEVADIYDEAVSFLKEKGFNRYEVSNFSIENYYSKHNLNYWKRGEYLGVGVGASSFISGRRFTNTESIDEYVKAILSNFSAEIFSETVSEVDAKGEYAMLALRTSLGIDFSDYKNTFNSDFNKDFKKAINKNKSYLEISDKNIKIKDEYLYVQNTILVDLINF
ncbi:MAG: coproporphyrinogen III oxidase family protein, partial [Clostridia bacterium]|nr:coproporphyrinogen III oxidase family protein [Clostridia bacterium]